MISYSDFESEIINGDVRLFGMRTIWKRRLVALAVQCYEPGIMPGDYANEVKDRYRDNYGMSILLSLAISIAAQLIVKLILKWLENRQDGYLMIQQWQQDLYAGGA